MRERTTPRRVPLATYRLQVHKDFPLDAAADVAAYLARLGISTCYTSPIFRAAPGSTHGYDVCDHNEISHEAGGVEAYRRFSRALAQHGLTHLVDFVPNHMGISTGSNPWWRDVLENGPCSVSARFFDIDWDPAEPSLQNKLLLPILGDQYGLVLERGELQLIWDDDAIALDYFGERLPINPRQTPRVYRVGLDALQGRLGADHPDVLELLSIMAVLQHMPAYTVSTQEAIETRRRDTAGARTRLLALIERSEAVRAHIGAAMARVNGTPGDPSSFDELHDLLEAQPYRLASWRTAADEINYRRFFDINTLAAVRVEDPDVFASIHRLLRSLIASGDVAGVRIDHPDGLYDPAAYFDALRALAADAAPDRPQPLYVLAEKILSGREPLPAGWAVDGTTGYDFMNDVTGLFVDGRRYRSLVATYRRFTGVEIDWDEICRRSKRLIMNTAMASELSVLSGALARIARRDRRWRDFTRRRLRDAIVALVTCFPVYRTYITDRGWTERDAGVIDEAIACARRTNPAIEPSVFAFLRRVLLEHEGCRDAAVAFAMKLQQYTSPVQAKGVEDTAFYRYNVLLALNEVGGEPSRAGRTPRQFHAAIAARATRWPYTMNATATHDTKLGEDTRVRIAAISERPDEWRRGLAQWTRMARPEKTRVFGRPAPDRNDEYRFYQVLAGAWPAEPIDAPVPSVAPDTLVERLQQYMEKATREAKIHTSWISPNESYDRALRDFVDGLLRGPVAPAFLASFVPFARSLARAGAANALGQVLVKMAAPGVPDFYQGAELWDLSLVDPDNRRPVDFDVRARLIDDLEPLVRRARSGDASVAGEIRALLEAWHDGGIKLFTTQAGLGLRKERPDLFLDGRYLPLATRTPRGLDTVAFARIGGNAQAIAATATLTRGRSPNTFATGAVWSDASLALPVDIAATEWTNVLTGERIASETSPDAHALRLADVFATLPLALLVPSTLQAP